MSRAWLAITLVAGLTTVTARADESEQSVVIHGFGGWAYGKTDVNHYLTGTPDGEYDNANLSLNVSKRASERLAIVGQVEWFDNQGEVDVEFDYAFAEWKVNDALKLRVGRVKQPFGISSEVFDVGTLRPFYELPQVLYGPSGILGEAYVGVGLTGSKAGKTGWGVAYDVYFGGQNLEEYLPPEALLRGEPVGEFNAAEIERTRDLVGGRIVLETPVQGLRFGASGYTGHEIGSNRRTGYGFHGEYLAAGWSLRSEFAHESVADDVTARAFYGEAAYHFGAHWQAALQYGRLTTSLAGVDAGTFPSLREHKELAVGLNCWVTPEFVLKLSYHRVDGNRFAGPPVDALADTAQSGALATRTNLVLAGAQFTF